jgi:hypothetical protein
VGEGNAPTFKSLMGDTEWGDYGVGKNPKCANCMVHCGFEATAVADTFKNPLKALKVFLNGPVTEGEMAEELPVLYDEETSSTPRLVAKLKPVSSLDNSKKQVA